MRSLEDHGGIRPVDVKESPRLFEGIFAVKFRHFLLLLLLVFLGCGREKPDPNVVTVWHPWGGPQGIAFRRMIDAFEKAHPGVKVRPLFAPNDLSNNQKFFTSVAAGKPPDVIFVDGPQVAEWAERGALASLDDRVRKAGIKPSDYFTPCWKQNEYRGHVWAMTFCADPNFGFVWNRRVFRDAGLAINKPPATIAELDRLSDLITRRDGGKLARIGIIPWAQYGAANSLFTWGWAFGGSFYDEKRQRITANDPKIVKALEWMCSYAKKYDINKVASLQAGFQPGAQNPFYIGQMGMQCLHIGGIDDIRRFAPNLDYAIGFIPSPPGGESHSSWVGGWCMALPRGSRNTKLGWELIRWLCASDEGTLAAGQANGLFPGYRKSPYLKQARNQKNAASFLGILEECRHQRPVMPAQGFYMGAMNRAVDNALYGKMTPNVALDQATRETQEELDLVLGKRKD